MAKEVILTGLRANNDLHLGNYLGGLRPLVDLARHNKGRYQINLFVPDLHSFTTPVDHNDLRSSIANNLKVYIAAGLPLDDPDVHIYRQSYIPAHSELTWILDCFTGMGEMQRMTQFKDRAASLGADRLSVGLFNYPVLMAADILLYGAKFVPVGDDQTQHIEYARDIGERLNKQFGDLFNLPLPVKDQHAFFNKDQGVRIRDLIEPTRKMSKSDETGRGVIFLTDPPELIKQKLSLATTDSLGQIDFDEDKQPGISNLLTIMALLSAQDIKAITEKYRGQTSYGRLKADLTDVVTEFMTAFQAKLAGVDEAAIKAKLVTSEELMRFQAGATLLKVQNAVGLR